MRACTSLFLTTGPKIYAGTRLAMEFTLTFIKLFFAVMGLISPILLTLCSIIVVLGLIAGHREGWKTFDTLYWSFITAFTVGYGDITPQTNIGQFLSAVVMILGYAIIAVPTGIVTNEMMKASREEQTNTQVCRFCTKEGHDDDAIYCKACGGRLNE